MKNLFNILNTRKTGNIIAISIILIFTIFPLIRLYPFENTLNLILKGVDDWCRYARFASDIEHNGILMPSVKGNYFAPAGFMYNYFVALCFLVFGDNTVPVFIIQNLLLGLSVAFIYWCFRDKMQPLTGLAFLLTMSAFALLDMGKCYTFRLLSENLAVFLISVFFYCFIKGTEKSRVLLIMFSSFIMGLLILTRPNILLFGIVLIIIAVYYFIKQKKARVSNIFLFILILVLSSSFLAIRNHLVCGGWVFLPTEGIFFGVHFFRQDGFSFSYFIKKVLFCLGFLTPLEPAYLWRPHWTIMWIGYFIYIFFRIREKRNFEIWEITAHLFIFCYYILLLLIAPKLGSYGFRLLVPAIFIILPFSFMALDKIKAVFKNPG